MTTKDEQEPVLMFYEQEWQGKTSRAYQWLIDPFSLPAGTKLYTAPPAQQEPLTEDEIRQIGGTYTDEAWKDDGWSIAFARAIEAAHGIKGDA